MANPTTNYGFVLPTPTDLVTDLPADFDVALQGVDTRLKALQPGTTSGDLAYSSATANTNVRLPIGTSGQVLAVSGGGVPAWTTTADVTPLTTKGDLFTFSTVDARLGVGANNTILVADSAEATGLKWVAPAGGGKVLQVVQGTRTTGFNTSSGSAVDTGLSVTITPSSNTSKIYISAFASIYWLNSASSANNDAIFTLVRASTQLQQFINGVQDFGSSTGKQFYDKLNFTHLDSPATTSATNYKITAQVNTCSSLFLDGSATNIASIIAMEIGA